jgi:hypothetical protein
MLRFLLILAILPAQISLFPCILPCYLIETGAMSTAYTTTQSGDRGDFLADGE